MRLIFRFAVLAPRQVNEMQDLIKKANALGINTTEEKDGQHRIAHVIFEWMGSRKELSMCYLFNEADHVLEGVRMTLAETGKNQVNQIQPKNYLSSKT